MVKLFSFLNMLFEILFPMWDSEERQKEILIGQLLTTRGDRKKEVLFPLI